MLDRLPQELLDIVVGFLPKDDRQAINMVSRGLSARTLHLHYQTLTFSARSEWALNVLNIGPFIEARSESGRLEQHLGCVQDLRFSAPFRVARIHRCSYRTGFWYDQHIGDKRGTSHDMFHADFLCDILNQLRAIFDNLKIDSLRSFRWHMGTCLPAHILDEDGYLTTCQQNIQLLSLQVDAACQHAGLRLGGLVSMRNLRSLSWECISTVEELSLLQRCLEHNAHNLRSLELAFTRFSGIDGDAFMATMGELPNLQSLSLARFHFHQDARRAFYRILPHLESLTLRDCPGQLTVLEAFSLLDIPLRLKCFEISFDEAYEPENFDASHPLIDFLTSFDTLVQLHMLVSNVLNPERHIRIARSHPTLRQFVYHTRNLLSTFQVIPEETQYVHAPLFEPLGSILCRNPLQNLGLCLHPFMAKAMLEPIAPKIDIEVLHLRLGSHEHFLCDFVCTLGPKIGYLESEVDHPWDDHLSTGSESDHLIAHNVQEDMASYCHECPVLDLVELADWAFGPHGIKSLKALAYGDFSHGDRYYRQQVLLIRDAHSSAVSPYRISSLKKAPAEVQDTVAACPLEYLMDSNEPWQT